MHGALGAHAGNVVGVHAVRGFGLADDAALDDHVTARFHMRRFDGALHHHIAGHAYRHAGTDIAGHSQRSIERNVAGVQIDRLDIDHRADADAVGQHARRPGDHGQQAVRVVGIGGHAGQVHGKRHVDDRIGGDRLAQDVHAVLARLGRGAAHQRGAGIHQQQAAKVAQVNAVVFVFDLRRPRLLHQAFELGRLALDWRNTASDLAAFTTARLERNADRRGVKQGDYAHRRRRRRNVFGGNRAAAFGRHQRQQQAQFVAGDFELKGAVQHNADHRIDLAVGQLALREESGDSGLVEPRALPALLRQQGLERSAIRRHASGLWREARPYLIAGLTKLQAQSHVRCHGSPLSLSMWRQPAGDSSPRRSFRKDPPVRHLIRSPTLLVVILATTAHFE